MSIPITGFVLHIIRERVENRGSGSAKRYRTVGRYQCFMDGTLLSSAIMSGATAEPRGPGDNGNTGKTHSRRIEAGTYQLGTHSGARYGTFNYAFTSKKPALYVHDTNKRTYILVHPGNRFKSSVGCINLTGSLINTADNISPVVSANRLDSLIKTMDAALGSRFPNSGAKRIQDAWIVIEGEP